MEKVHPGCRVFILGAGFSRPAGLPLALELFPEIRRRIEADGNLTIELHRNRFRLDVENYIQYQRNCFGRSLTPDEIDFEEFISYLDMNHVLGLGDGSSESQDGSPSQTLVKRLISQIIYERTPAAHDLPKAYYEFAESLCPGDTVITFNYDLVLERALSHVRKSYRYSEFGSDSTGRTSDLATERENRIKLLKMHGSIDWFDERPFSYFMEVGSVYDPPVLPGHSVFQRGSKIKSHPVGQGRLGSYDDLRHLYRVESVDDIYAAGLPHETPFILSPSHVKFVYASPLFDFWHEIGALGEDNLGICIIGFSLSDHDEHIRIVLHRMVSSYQNKGWNDTTLGRRKTNVKLVDFQPSKKGLSDYVKRFQFVDFKKADIYSRGFGEAAVKFIFGD
jgi:hypothetical protein